MKKIFVHALAMVALTSVVKAEDGTSLSTLASSISELRSVVAELSKTVQQQQGELSSLRAENVALKQKAEKAEVASTAGSVQVAPPAPQRTLGQFNPDIGIVADITGLSSESSEDEEGNDRISAREVELVIGHDVDPYTRLDTTITFSDFEDVTLEEAYITRWGLPLDSSARFGRFRPKVGISSAVHRDQLDTADQPLVIQRYFGVEGLYKSGLELSGFVPSPFSSDESVTHQLFAGVVEGGIGEEGTLFGETRRRLSYYGRLRNFWEVSDYSDLSLGGTYMIGSSDEDSGYEVGVLGLDLVGQHHFNSTNKLKIQSEFYLQDRDAPYIEVSEHGEIEESEPMAGSPYRSGPWGMYALADYRLSESFALGGRYDYVKLVNISEDDTRSADQGWSAYLTYYQSEFARWRAQFEHLEFASGDEDNRVFLQGTFAIGVHKHSLN